MAFAATTTLTYSPDKRLLNITIETSEGFTWKDISGNLKSLADNLEKEPDNDTVQSSTGELPGMQRRFSPTNSGHLALVPAEGKQPVLTIVKEAGVNPAFTEWYDK